MKSFLLKNTKNLSLLLPFAFVGCSSSHSSAPSAIVVKTPADRVYVDSQNAILNGSANLFQLEALIPGLRNQGQGLSMIPDISSPQAKHDILVVKLKEQDRANEFLHGYSDVAADKDILSETLQWNYLPTTLSSKGPDQEIMKTAIGDEQTAMEMILIIYDQDASSKAQIIAEANIQALPANAKQQIMTARQLSGSEKEAAFKKIIADNHLSSTNSIDADKREVAEKYVNKALLDLLSGNQDIYNLVVDAATLKDAYDKIQITIDAVQKFADTFQGALKQIYNTSNAIQSAASNASNELGLNVQVADLDSAARKKWLNNAGAYLGVLTGKDDTDDSFPSLDGAEKSYQDLKTSAGQMAEATNAVGQATAGLAEAAKLLNLDANTQNTLNQAAAIAEAGSKIMEGFATGGPLGAVVAGLQASSMFGGEDASAAANKVINAKLDALLKGQQKIIGLQQETLKLQDDTLKILLNVAQMIQTNQSTLSGIEGEIVSLSQGQSVQLLLNYSKCMKFANVRSLNKNDPNFDSQIQTAVHALLGDLNSLGLKLHSDDDHQQYNECLEGLSDIYLNADFTSFINSPGANVTENMLDENGSLIDVDMAKQIYFPLTTIYENFTLKNHRELASPEAYASGLHLPVRLMSIVHRKYNIFIGNTSASEGYSHCTGTNPNDLSTCLNSSYKYLKNSFIYTPMVIKNIKALLQWAPMIAAIGEDGNWNATKPLNAKSSDATVYNILQNALGLVQASIAQESLVAGEPVLEQLYEGFLQYLDDQKQLKTNPHYTPPNSDITNFFHPISDEDLASKRVNCENDGNVYMTAGCLFRKDPYLAKNFVNYFLQRRVLELHLQEMSQKGLNDYETNFVGAPDAGTYIGLDVELKNDTLPMDQLTEVFGTEFVQSNIIPAKPRVSADGKTPIVERRQFVIGGVTMDVPTEQQYSKDLIIYSPNMQELVGLERQLALALAKFEKPIASDDQIKTWVGNLFQVTQ